MNKCILCYNQVDDLKAHLESKHLILVHNFKDAIENFSLEELEISNCQKGSYKGNSRESLDSKLTEASALEIHILEEEDFKTLLERLEQIHYLDLQDITYHEMIERFTPFIRTIVKKIESSKETIKETYINELYSFLKYHNYCNAGIVGIEIIYDLSYSERLTEIIISLLDVHKYNDYFDACIQYLVKYDKTTLIPLIKKAKNCELRRTQYSGVLDVLGEKFGTGNQKWLKLLKIIILGLINNNYSVDDIFWEGLTDMLYELSNVKIRNSVDNEKALRNEVLLIINTLLDIAEKRKPLKLK